MAAIRGSGSENEIYPFASIGLKTQDLKWKGGLTRTEIGDSQHHPRCVTIHSATGDGEATVIGSHTDILASSHIAHNVVIGNHVIMSNGRVAGHMIKSKISALVGGLAAVHQFCRIGNGAHDWRRAPKWCRMSPPYMLVDGNPAEARAINKIG